MTSLKELSVGRKDIFKIPVGGILFKEGQNPREDFSHVEGLAQSIMQYGQLEPIKVKMGDDGYAYGVHGESRYRAILLANKDYDAGIETIDCVSAPKDYDETDIMIEHFERGSTNKPLTALECAKVYKHLKEVQNYSVGDICTRCRKSDQHVYDHLKLLEAPLSVLEQVRAGKMSADAAISIAKMEESKREKAVKKLGLDGDNSGEPEAPRERITKKDVETAVDGHPRQISAKEIREYAKMCDKRIHAAGKGSKEQIKWEGVRYGLETALGMHDDDWKQKGEI
jgi:ParB/RepB/Spo0J family partition protein